MVNIQEITSTEQLMLPIISNHESEIDNIPIDEDFSYEGYRS